MGFLVIKKNRSVLCIHHSGMSQRYKIGEQIGRGATSAVYLGFDLQKQKQVIIKIVEVSRVNMFHQEVRTLQELKQHRNIVRILAKSSFPIDHPNPQHIIILEPLDSDLLSYINEKPLMSNQIIQIMKETANAVKYCHSKCIAHLDIKPENILVSSDLTQVKLCDFGGSVQWNISSIIQMPVSSTPIYSAPEMHNNNQFLGDKADIWSLGVLLHLLCTKKFPFPGDSNEECLSSLKSGQISIHPSFPLPLVSILIKMLSLDPMERPNAKVVFHYFDKAARAY